MEVPLHVAMSSLLRNLAEGYSARFYLILTGFTEQKLALLRKTLDKTQRNYSLHLLETADTSIFSGFPDLHGSYATYYRLLLPELVNEDRLLYLDSDLRVNIDIAPLFEAEMGSHAAGFAVDGVVAGTLDRDFQLSVGRAPDDPSFNAGVVLMNLIEWRRQGCSEKVFAFGRKWGAQLVNRDQSLLNALFANDCYQLETRFNTTVKATTDPRTVPADAIVHYIGSPKPWDIGGRWMHACARPWFHELRKTAVPLPQRTTWLDRYAWTRLPKILGGYRRILKWRISRVLGK
jgi:lipopolysaccharide biosynthesis glycosyltransferase